MIDHFTWVDAAVAVGRAPFDDDREWLAAQGVTGLLSLQSDQDLRERGIDWERWAASLAALGIDARRVPVTDFDRGDLLRHLDQGVAALAALVDAGRRVYVHCNAGINRSPSVVIGWRVAHLGETLGDATDHVLSLHRPCYPYPEVMRAWDEGRTKTSQ